MVAPKARVVGSLRRNIAPATPSATTIAATRVGTSQRRGGGGAVAGRRTPNPSIGFSLGGNLTLKYLGEKQSQILSVKKAVVFSVPLNLYSSCVQISKNQNWIYSHRFLTSLKNKVIKKANYFNELDTKGLSKIKTLIDFDNQITGPIHGFKNAIDYYERCSSIRFIDKISLPTMIINAQNDPFLSKDCYPQEQTINNSNLNFQYPNRGGHVGFTEFNRNGLYWSEQQTLGFLKS